MELKWTFVEGSGTNTLELSSVFRFVTDFLGYLTQSSLSATHISWLWNENSNFLVQKNPKLLNAQILLAKKVMHRPKKKLYFIKLNLDIWHFYIF